MISTAPRMAFLLGMLCLAACAGEGVSREEFLKLTEEFTKFKTENAKLREDNAQLRADNTVIKEENQRLRQDVDSLKAPNRPAASQVNQILTAKDVERIRERLDSVKSGTTKFTLSGYGVTNYEDRRDSPGAFSAAFSPLFLWQTSENLYFESRLVFVDDDMFHFLYADASYIVNDYLTLTAGKFPSPFAYFGRNLREVWANKLTDFPLHSRLAPFNSTGVMASGAFSFEPAKFNWAIAVSNGPALVNFGTNIGLLDHDQIFDVNQNKNVTGRLGVLPIPSLELGFSFDVGRVGPAQTPQHDVDARIFAADLSFIRTVAPIKGEIDLRSEWVWSDVSGAAYGDSVIDPNRRNGGYAQLSYRPTLVKSKIVRNLEPVIRYERMSEPKLPGILTGGANRHFISALSRERWSFGLDYWLGASSAVKFQYEYDSIDDRSFLMQYVIGF